jgi:hypothetical protein
MGVRATRQPGRRSVKLSREHHDHAVLITEAEPSLADQHRARKRKYTILMSLRVVFLILAATFYRLTWLMLLFAVCAVALPWMAVLIANDRPPRKTEKVNTLDRDPKHLENDRHQIIDTH